MDDIGGLLDELRDRGLLPPATEAVPVRAPGPGLDPAQCRDAYRGALVGGAVGDALGRPAEGRPRHRVRERYGELWNRKIVAAVASKPGPRVLRGAARLPALAGLDRRPEGHVHRRHAAQHLRGRVAARRRRRSGPGRTG